MEETTTPTGQPQEETKPLNIVEEAQKVRDEIKAENDRREALLQEEQRMKANEVLAGDNGGNVQAEPAKEETPKEYADRMLRGEANE